jgi:hypothetical protein
VKLTDTWGEGVERDAIELERTMRLRRRTERKEVMPIFGQLVSVFTVVIVEVLNASNGFFNDAGIVSVNILQNSNSIEANSVFSFGGTFSTTTNPLVLESDVSSLS